MSFFSTLVLHIASIRITIVIPASLHVPFSHLSLLCNPSPLLPRHHSSSPCKLSCSEPQRALLSVELRILSFFHMLASMFLVCPASISCLFSNLFLRSYGFSRVSFLQFPHFPNGFLDFLGFSKLAIHLFLQCNCFFTIFLHFPPFSPCF